MTREVLLKILVVGTMTAVDVIQKIITITVHSSFQKVLVAG